MLKQSFSPNQTHPLWQSLRFSRWSLIVGFIVIASVGISSCVELTDSAGFRCTSDSDCWDGLKCTDELCGGKRRTVKEEEPPKSDAGPEPVKETTPTEGNADTPKDDGVCKGNTSAVGICKENSDCCTGTTCKQINNPFDPKASGKLCAGCAKDADCQQGFKCCTEAKPILGDTICAPSCEAPKP